MPLSQLVPPSFTLILSDSVTLRDFQNAQNREIHIPVHAPSSDEGSMVQRVHDVLFPVTETSMSRPQHTIDQHTAPASAFITYKCTYHQDQDAASLFGDVNDEELAPDGDFWRCLKMALFKVKGFGGRLFTALFFTT